MPSPSVAHHVRPDPCHRLKKTKRLRSPHYIRAWREYRGLNQQRAADRIGMSRENYSRIENAILPYNQDFLEAAAVAFNCSKSDLIERDPRIEDDVEQLRSLLLRASPEDRKRVTAVAKTLLNIKN